MAIAVLFEFPADSIDKYDRVLKAGGNAVEDQPERPYHVCFETGSGFSVLDVWESEEAFGRFGALLGPALQEAELSTEPKIYRVHNIMTA